MLPQGCLQKQLEMELLPEIRKGKLERCYDIERETHQLVDYLECIRENFCNDHPDHASSSETSTERQDFVECVSAEERWNSNNGLRTEKTKLYFNLQFGKYKIMKRTGCLPVARM